MGRRKDPSAKMKRSPFMSRHLVWMTAAALMAASQSMPGAVSEGGGATLTFTYENPKLQPATYKMLIRADGSGHYHSEPGSAVQTGPGPQPGPVDTDIQISQPLLGTIFAMARSKKFQAGNCEDAGPHIAFQGTKRLIIEGPDGRGECEFNWSKDKQVQDVTSQLQAVSYTLETGRRLTVEHLHDRLALDAELDLLQQEVASGRAQELGNIAPVLQAIANDETVLERARKRARALLAEAKK